MSKTVTTSAIKPGTRLVERTLSGTATSDGMGVRLTRIIGKAALPDLDPFLMLDEFRSDDSADYIGGFPDHPHRGFETVTYMLAGQMRHGDNQGNTGLLKPGGVQWMSAGRGIVHSEMPEQVEGLMWGFQLWVNLPAKDKMSAPRYQDIAPEQIPVVSLADGVTVRVIAGKVGDVAGPVKTGATDPVYLDVALPARASFTHAVPAGTAAFVYVFDGAVEMDGNGGPERVGRGELAVLGPGTAITARAAETPARLLLVAGRPLNEPIAKYGPFVMNTEAEVREAFADYRAGKF